MTNQNLCKPLVTLKFILILNIVSTEIFFIDLGCDVRNIEKPIGEVFTLEDIQKVGTLMFIAWEAEWIGLNWDLV